MVVLCSSWCIAERPVLEVLQLLLQAHEDRLHGVVKALHGFLFYTAADFGKKQLTSPPQQKNNAERFEGDVLNKWRTAASRWFSALCLFSRNLLTASSLRYVQERSASACYAELRLMQATLP